LPEGLPGCGGAPRSPGWGISPGDLGAFLDFLQAEAGPGRVVVETTAQVIGGP
jgi:hypothetical protein